MPKDWPPTLGFCATAVGAGALAGAGMGIEAGVGTGALAGAGMGIEAGVEDAADADLIGTSFALSATV